MMATKKKNLNATLDDLLSGLDLPTDAEVKAETGQVNRTQGIKNNSHKIKEGVKKAHQDPVVKAKFKTAIKNRDQSFRNAPGYSEKHSAQQKKTVASDKWKQNHKAAIEALQNDPVRLAEYKKNYAKGNSKKYDNPEYWENYYKGIAKRDADEEYTKKRLDASRAKICKKVHTPLGVFESITAASIAYGMSNSETMRNRIKSPNFPEFYIVEE